MVSLADLAQSTPEQKAGGVLEAISAAPDNNGPPGRAGPGASVDADAPWSVRVYSVDLVAQIGPLIGFVLLDEGALGCLTTGDRIGLGLISRLLELLLDLLVRAAIHAQ